MPSADAGAEAAAEEPPQWVPPEPHASTDAAVLDIETDAVSSINLCGLPVPDEEGVIHLAEALKANTALEWLRADIELLSAHEVHAVRSALRVHPTLKTLQLTTPTEASPVDAAELFDSLTTGNVEAFEGMCALLGEIETLKVSDCAAILAESRSPLTPSPSNPRPR